MKLKEFVVYKFLIVSLCAVFVLSACGGAESRKAKYLESGNQHYSQDDCNKAKLDYKNVLQIDPKSVDGLIGLARCMLEDKEWRKGYQLLNGALENDPASIDAKLDLAKLYLISGESEQSYQYIEDVLEVMPKNATAIALRGIFHLKNNTLTAARIDSEEAISLEGDNLSAITLFSSLKVKDGETDQAASYISNIVQNNSITKRKKKELQVILIALYDQLKDTDSVILIYKDLIAQYPNNNSYLYRLSALYANNGQVDEAESLLLTSIDAEDSDSQLAYISFLDAFKSSEEATKTLEKFNSQSSNSGKLALALGKRYLASDESEKAIALFTSLANDVSVVEHIEAKNELAFLHLKDNDAASALALVEQVLSDQPNNLRALVIRGTLAISNRDAPQAVSDFRTILRDQPSNTFAIRQLATAYILNDQEDLAKELLQKAVDIDNHDKSLSLLYARLQGKDNEFESAIGTVNDLLETNQEDLETIKTLFDLQIANKDYAGAKQTAASMKSALKDNPLGYYLSGVLLQNENNNLAAEKEYLIALEKEPRANEPLSGLVRLYLFDGKHAKAIELLQGMIDKDPEYLVPYNLLGEVAMSIEDYSLAEDSFKSAIDINHQWWVPYRGLSLVHAANGEKEKSLQILKRGFDNGVGVERLGMELALNQYQLGQRDASIKTYEKIISEIPTSTLSKNNLSMILVDDQANDQDINKALTFIADLENIEDAASLDTVGWVNYRAGNIDKAIEFLTRATELAPDAAELHYHLGMAYASKEEGIEKAKMHLKIASESEQQFMGKETAKAKYKQLLL